ncbi:hypothetical protein SELMODRAFT_418320 [Selaginella moellendorffii]|uniref:Stearoyl-[acyl-carrier-protein] 9-desaturase n=1 Tax=Selaginella moellendorffii TaxID=88036 RepID=D8S5B9_SELML|nr:hypothetical protein SELMODRAFT_418320 [Selaginella moellendorffii]
MELDLDGAHAWFFLLGCFLSPLCRKKAKSSTRFPTPPAAHRTKSGPTWGHPGSGVFLWRRRLQMGLVGNLQEGAAALVEAFKPGAAKLQTQAAASAPTSPPIAGSVAKQDSSKTSQIMHWLSTEKIEMFKSLETWAEESILPFLRPVEKCWQPQDYLPEPSSESFYDEVLELRERAESLRFCLVGDMTTEEALPTYLTMLNTLDGTRDETGASPSPWAVVPGLPRRIAMVMCSTRSPDREQSISRVHLHVLPGASHCHTATLLTTPRSTETTLATVCGLIAADEKRHENAYTRIVFEHFSLVAQRTGV